MRDSLDITQRWDNRFNVWAEMNSKSVGIEADRGERNEFPVQTILGTFTHVDDAMNFVYRLRNEFWNEFRVHLFTGNTK
jgi:hypothetical protein